MQKDEQLKAIVDQFGKLSFLLETYVKFHQTGDCTKLNMEIFKEAHIAASSLLDQIENLNDYFNEQNDNI